MISTGIRNLKNNLSRYVRRVEVGERSEEILSRAGRAFPREPVRTLDAVHLATIEALGEAPPIVTVVTRDDRVAENARALGYMVV